LTDSALVSVYIFWFILCNVLPRQI
jgi:hypothetical protein